MIEAKGLETLDHSGEVTEMISGGKFAIIQMTHRLKGFALINYYNENDISVGDIIEDIIPADLLGGPGQVKNKSKGRLILITLIRSNCNKQEVINLANQNK